MNQDFDYREEVARAMDPRRKDHSVVYPSVKLWHVAVVVLAGLAVVSCWLELVPIVGQPEMGPTALKKMSRKKLL